MYAKQRTLLAVPPSGVEWALLRQGLVLCLELGHGRADTEQAGSAGLPGREEVGGTGSPADTAVKPAFTILEE